MYFRNRLWPAYTVHMSQGSPYPPAEALCLACQSAIKEATLKVFGYGEATCPHCQRPYLLNFKLKDERTLYDAFYQQMCVPCAVDRQTCQFCLEPAGTSK